MEGARQGVIGVNHKIEKKKGEERSGSFKLKDSFFELCVELSDDDLLCLL